ncbi:conserved Plasmodium protein, unknown function [Plasmodium ovale curtisi]|uniref:Uncharacterized protein n=1 Tax=Plasmodium ovale curtisi TaxID=864141 RepID=A0A1A8XBJ9_PLAOA|nr:conserved Plasmodium protein, unknown function [Plasmodium ovale curtisi]
MKHKKLFPFKGGALNISLKKITYENEIIEYSQRFLVIKNSQKLEHVTDVSFINTSPFQYCEGKNLLSASNPEKLFSLSKALDICESMEACDFVSYSPKRILQNSVFYEDEGELRNTGASWTCSGIK